MRNNFFYDLRERRVREEIFPEKLIALRKRMQYLILYAANYMCKNDTLPITVI